MARNDNITVEQLALVVRRKQKLRESMDEVEALLTGRGTPLADLARPTPAGRRALVRRLVAADAVNEAVDALKEAGQFSRYRGAALSELPAAPADSHADLMAAFFSCAVSLAGATPWYAGAIDDIVALGRSVQRHRGRERLLLLEELYDGTDYLAEDVPRPDDFFAMMDDVYQVLAGRPVAETIPAPLRAWAAALDPALFSEEARTAQQFPLSPEQLDAAVAAGAVDAAVAERNRAAVQAHWDELIDEAARLEPWEARAQEVTDREDARRRARTRERLDAWRNGFAEAEAFCESYRVFREEFFEGAGCPADFSDRVERAVETVLVQEGRSLLARKAAADEAVYLLGRVRARLARGGE